MLLAANGKRQTSLMVAVQSGREEVVDAVVKLMGETWVPADEKVRDE